VKPDQKAGADGSVRYRIDGEIARGGMGAILKGRDPDLGRDVALKVLREDYRDRPDMVRRFVEEAQIGGQLQHPGIVPVYELGAFADRRPFFSMKLVKGRTLAGLLAERTAAAPAADLPRFLAIFLQVAQTVTYAHARGVIHRDLKPSNVMVGSFGEVQVMDWGLAKVLPRGGHVDDARAGKAPDHETVIATARSGGGPGSDRSHAGSVLGTPSNMAPEQARGEVDRVDERADVFALGAILCEILTGSPPFTGPDSRAALRKAAAGSLDDAYTSLDTCGADAELVGLAKHCLAREPEGRPRDAGVVAERMGAYLTGVQERLRAAERDRAVAEARAVEERKRRRLQLGLAASVLALTTLGGLGTTYYLQQRQARRAATDGALGAADTLLVRARGDADDPVGWRLALAAVAQADDALGPGADPEARRRLEALRIAARAGLDAAERDRALLDRQVDIRSTRSARVDDPGGSATDAAYADAFREAGLDLDALDPAEVGARIRTRPGRVALALATALDDWAAVRRIRRKDAAEARRLSEAARAADPDPWRGDLRAALDRPDKAERLAALKALAGSAPYDELGPVTLVLLGKALAASGDGEAAESVLREAQRRHPGDIWANLDLAGSWRAGRAARRRFATTRRPAPYAPIRRTHWHTPCRRRTSRPRR
jgi:serine/threonine-protein kinase